MALVGGVGTMIGPIIGAAVVILLENKVGDLGTWLAKTTGVNWFNSLGESVTVVTGLIFVLCVLLFRRGVVGELDALFKSRTAR
jgi:branched-chain amino acid transport system permease protein